MRRLLVLASTLFTLLAMALATGAQATIFTGGVSFSLGGLAPQVASGTGWGTSIATPPKPGPCVLGDVATITSYPPTYPLPWAAVGPVRIGMGPSAFPISAVTFSLVAPGPCSFTDAPGNVLGGPCALGGAWSASVAGRPFLVIPLSGLGVTGRVSFGPYGSYIDAQQWRTGTATFTINGVAFTTTNGAPLQTAGYDNRTAGGLGTVNLVAPAGLMSTLGGNTPLFVSMTLTFVPEPGTLLLLGLGVAGLAVVGRRRSRH
jgi:hypothetical protein